MQPVNDLRFSVSAKLQKLPLLTEKKIKILEAAEFLEPQEKVRLLAVLSRQRWITEVDVRRKREGNPKIVSLLNKMGLAWSDEHYVKRDGGKVYWLEVGGNEAVLLYLKQNRRRLSVMEAGILYGYPTTSVLACAGVIEEYRKTAARKTPAERCLGGIFSREFIEKEERYLKGVWEHLRGVSPTIIVEAEKRLSGQGTTPANR